MGVDGRNDVNNGSIKDYVPDTGTGRIQLASNDGLSPRQALSQACETRRNFFSIPVIKRFIILLFVLSVNWPVDAATPGTTSVPEPTLKRREGPPPEGCENHVARTRHAYLDTAQVVGDPRARRDLLTTYNHLRNDKLVIRMCTQPKFLVWYDLDLSMVELQRQYIISR
jgi:hypothetical protein